MWEYKPVLLEPVGAGEFSSPPIPVTVGKLSLVTLVREIDRPATLDIRLRGTWDGMSWTEIANSPCSAPGTHSIERDTRGVTHVRVRVRISGCGARACIEPKIAFGD